MIDVTEILVHWHAGRSLNEMAQSLSADRKTILKYIAPAVAAGIVPGGPGRSEGEWQDLVREWFPELADTRLRQVTWPAIAVHHDYIVEQLKARVRMSTIHQRLRDERGLAASIASFRRYVSANVPEEARRQQVTVWNPRPAEAGEQAQIDYGMLGRWADPATGRLRTVWAFVMVLACSRHMFVRPVLTMDQRAWTECHVEAFEFFGGVPARLVPENVAGHIFGDQDREHAAEELPGRLAARDHRQRRLRERQVHVAVAGEHRREHQRVQLPAPLPVGDHAEVAEVDLQLTARRRVVDPHRHPRPARRETALGRGEPRQRPVRDRGPRPLQQLADLHQRQVLPSPTR